MEYGSLLINLLYQMAYVDGVFHDNEKMFITEVMESNNIQVEDMMKARVRIPSDERDRMTILYYLLFLIRADKEVTEQEYNFAHKFGLQLGFRSEMITRMLDTMKQHMDEKLQDDELIKIIRQYLN